MATDPQDPWFDQCDRAGVIPPIGREGLPPYITDADPGDESDTPAAKEAA